MKRALKIVGLVAAGLLLLIALGFGAIALFVDLDGMVAAQLKTAKPAIEEKLGRKVEFGTVKTHLFPTVGGSIAGASIAADPAHAEDDQPLVQAKSIGFDISLWRALFTFGQSIVINEIHVDGLSLSLVRYKDGSLSIEDIMQRQAATAEPIESDQGEDEGLSPTVRHFLQNISIGELRVAEARIRLADDAAGPSRVESVISHLNIRLRDVRLSDAIRLHLDAAVFSEAKNLEFDTEVGPLPDDLRLEGLPRIGSVKLAAKAIDLSKLAPYLSGGGTPDLRSATFGAELTVTEATRDQPFDIKGSLRLDRVQFTGGEPFDILLDLATRLELSTLSASIERLKLAVGELTLEAKGEVKNLATQPSFKDLSLSSSTLNPQRLFAYYPALGAALPKGSKLEGNGALAFTASGDTAKQALVGSLDFTGLELNLPGTFWKPRGTPFQLKLEGSATSELLTIDSFAFQLDKLLLSLSGTVKQFDAPTLDLKLRADTIVLDSLARLLPSVRAALESSKSSASGVGTLTGHLKGSASALDGALDLAFTGMALDAAGANLKGGVKLAAAFKGNPSANFDASLNLDGGDSVIVLPGTLNKAASTPLSLKLTAARAGALLSLKEVALRLAELDMGASGSFDLEKGNTAVTLSMKRLDLERFAKTVTAIPPAIAKGGFVEASLALSGNPNKLESMELALAPFKAQLGASDLAGSVKLKNLKAVGAEVALTSRNLDLDQLFPPSKEEEAKPEAKSAPREDDPSLKDYRLDGTLKFDRVMARKSLITNLKTKLKVANGLARFEECTLNVYGGTVSTTGSQAEFWRGRMPFVANLSVRGVEANEALSALTRYHDTLYGKANMEIHMTGRGFETADLERSLNGDFSLDLTNGRFSRGSLLQSALGDLSALKRIPGVKLSALEGESRFDDLHGEFKVTDGKINLVKPIETKMGRDRAILTGGLGVAGGLFLNTDYLLAPATVSTLTSGKCSTNSELKVPMKIGGTVAKPAIRPDGAGLALSIGESCLKGKAAELIGEKLGVDVSKATDAAKAAKEEAAKRAQQLKDEAERAKAAAEAKAKAAAEKKKKEAADAAKKKAEKLLKGIR